MSKTTSSESIKQFIKWAIEAGTIVTGIVTYIVGITGNAPGRTPQLISFLLVVASVSALWVARWPRLSRRGKNREKKRTVVTHIEDFFRTLFSGDDAYVLSPILRRSEGFALLALTLFSVGRLSLKAPDVWLEINPPQTPVYGCERPAKAILIADFYEAASGETVFEERIFNEMISKIEGNKVCRLKVVIHNPKQAAEALEKGNAWIIVWGLSDQSAMDTHIQARHWDDLEEVIWSFTDAENFEKVEAEHITFLAQYINSLFGFIDGDMSQAQAALEKSLPIAKGQAWSSKYPEDLADAYFLLGQMVSGVDDLTPERLEAARKAYTEAIDINNNLDRAILNRGSVCNMLDDLECAMQDFDTLIQRNSYLAAAAYINRSLLQPTRDAAEADLEAAIKLQPLLGYSSRAYARERWGDLSGAISDYRKAAQLDPKNCYLLHELGMTLLQNGETESATQTYTEAHACLKEDPFGKEDKAYFIDELQILCATQAGLCPAIDKIITILKK